MNTPNKNNTKEGGLRYEKYDERAAHGFGFGFGLWLLIFAGR